MLLIYASISADALTTLLGYIHITHSVTSFVLHEVSGESFVAAEQMRQLNDPVAALTWPYIVGRVTAVSFHVPKKARGPDIWIVIFSRTVSETCSYYREWYRRRRLTYSFEYIVDHNY